MSKEKIQIECSFCGKKIYSDESAYLFQNQDGITLEIRHEKCLEENLKKDSMNNFYLF